VSVSVLQNAGLAIVVFAVLYAISRGSERCAALMARRRKPSSEPNDEAQSRIPTAKFGANFKRS
jgi:hypothetical protein